VSSPATRKFRQYLRDYQDYLKEQWGHGQFQREVPDAYAVADTDAVARCQAFGDLADMSFEFMSGFYDRSSEEESEPDDGSE